MASAMNRLIPSLPGEVSSSPGGTMAHAKKEVVQLVGFVRVNGLRQPVGMTVNKFTRDGFPAHFGHYDVVSGPVIAEGEYEIAIPGHGTIRMRYQQATWTAV